MSGSKLLMPLKTMRRRSGKPIILRENHVSFTFALSSLSSKFCYKLIALSTGKTFEFLVTIQSNTQDIPNLNAPCSHLDYV